MADTLPTDPTQPEAGSTRPSSILVDVPMTLDALQRAYWRWQWANGTAIYAAQHGRPEELAAAEKAALDRYEEYLRAKVAYYGPQETGATAA
jgi:hypothetical protein